MKHLFALFILFALGATELTAKPVAFRKSKKRKNGPRKSRKVSNRKKKTLGKKPKSGGKGKGRSSSQSSGGTSSTTGDPSGSPSQEPSNDLSKELVPVDTNIAVSPPGSPDPSQQNLWEKVESIAQTLAKKNNGQSNGQSEAFIAPNHVSVKKANPTNTFHGISQAALKSQLDTILNKLTLNKNRAGEKLYEEQIEPLNNLKKMLDFQLDQEQLLAIANMIKPFLSSPLTSRDDGFSASSSIQPADRKKTTSIPDKHFTTLDQWKTAQARESTSSSGDSCAAFAVFGRKNASLQEIGLLIAKKSEYSNEFLDSIYVDRDHEELQKSDLQKSVDKVKNHWKECKSTDDFLQKSPDYIKQLNDFSNWLGTQQNTQKNLSYWLNEYERAKATHLPKPNLLREALVLVPDPGISNQNGGESTNLRGRDGTWAKGDATPIAMRQYSSYLLTLASIAKANILIEIKQFDPSKVYDFSNRNEDNLYENSIWSLYPCLSGNATKKTIYLLFDHNHFESCYPSTKNVEKPTNFLLGRDPSPHALYDLNEIPKIKRLITEWNDDNQLFQSNVYKKIRARYQELIHNFLQE